MLIFTFENCFRTVDEEMIFLEITPRQIAFKEPIYHVPQKTEENDFTALKSRGLLKSMKAY